MKNNIKNEVIKTLQDYSGTGIHFFDNQEESLKRIDMYLKEENLHKFEEPDAYSIIDDDLLIIEHFEFDSMYTNRKGSKSRQEKAIANSNFQEIGITEKNQVHYRTQFTSEMNINNYVDNLIRNLKKHVSKIDNYKKRIQNNENNKVFSSIKILFIIEDTTLLGNFDSASGETLMPLYCKELLDFIEKTDTITYVIACWSVGDKKDCFFLDKRYIDDYRKYQFSKDSIKIAQLTPRGIYSKFKIPQE